MEFDEKGNKRKGVEIGREKVSREDFLFFKTRELAKYLYTDKNDPEQNKKVDHVIKIQKKQ